MRPAYSTQIKEELYVKLVMVHGYIVYHISEFHRNTWGRCKI